MFRPAIKHTTYKIIYSKGLGVLENLKGYVDLAVYRNN
jgi:hypothetical protein